MTKLRLLTQNLLVDLKRLTAEADTIYWMTAFLMKSGVCVSDWHSNLMTCVPFILVCQ